MKVHKYKFESLFILFIIIIIFQKIPNIQSSLKCGADFISKGDIKNALQVNSDNLYGYEFAHRAGGNYYDHWTGLYWDSEPFCYDAYDNFTRPSKLSDIEGYTISEYDIVTNIEDAKNKESYILIEHDKTNLVNFHKKMCMTNNHTLTKYNHGEYELLIKMDNVFEENYLNTFHDFIFTIENPSNKAVTFSFKTRNFIKITEEINYTKEEWGLNMSQCNEMVRSEIPLIIENDTNIIQETVKPCIRDRILLNRTFFHWTEEYPIPEVFYFTNNYTIQPHQSRIINISLTFEKNQNEAEGGYFIISKDKGKSKEPYYWPVEVNSNNNRLKKLTNMEIILESNLPLGLSSFSLMRKRDLPENSYLGEKCNVKSYDNDNVLNGKCGDEYYCSAETDGKCEKCKNNKCKNCDITGNKCTKCFINSVEGQWNPPGGKGIDLPCDLDYIDITKIRLNSGNFKFEVPPAIHWRVTMDFWIWISDTSVLSDSNVNMNIIYKDFIAFTLRCVPAGLKIYATPIEWLYEYPTGEGYTTDSDYYQDKIKPYITGNIVNFLKKVVGSYDEVTIEDLVKDATSNWVYIRYAFDLDSSKHYLNDLPESNLKVPQIYTEQTGMPFHMKKFYGINKMTYLLFQNFYHPLTEEQYEQGKEITIYLRNLNIFREYMPQNIITKYYNLHSITSPIEFPQLLVSFPFSNLTLSSSGSYKMKGYNYYIRKETGEVVENQAEIKVYYLSLDDDIAFKPQRNFWRLNLLELNKQPTTCDFDELIDMKCDSPNEICFEDDKSFICEEGTDEQPYYLDINNFKCKPFCENGYMHPPRYSLSSKRLYCSQRCDTNSKQCPSDNYKYVDIHSNFLCSNNFFNLYYKCFNKNDVSNTDEYTGIFFSGFLRTPAIYIELPTKYEEFGIDFWYFPDYRLRYKRYYDNKEDKYDPKSLTERDKNKIIFLSDCCKVVYGTNSADIISFFVNNVARNQNAPSTPKFLRYNWNHFVLIYFRRNSGGYNFYLTFKNDQYNSYHYSNMRIEYDQNYWSAPSPVYLSKIIFCHMEGSEDFDPHLNSICQKAEWLDGFYRKLQVFDLKYSSRQPMFFTHHFEDDGKNGMLKHRYIFGLNSIVDNHLIDLIGNADGYVPSLVNLLSNQNLDGANYIIYETNFAPQGGIPSFSSSNYVSDISFIPPKISIKTTFKDQKCSVVSQETCLACKEGFSLFDKTCKGNVNANERTATYFYKNPGKNMPNRISLNLNFDRIINEPYFTIFFFIKIYGFAKNIPEQGPIKLLIFHQERKSNGDLEDVFYLGYHPTEGQKLFFYVNGKIMFSLNAFREYYFGIWIPVSFTAFREEDRRFKMNMAQATFLYYNLGFDSNYIYSDELFPYIKFTQFTITNNWIGLLSDIKIYNKFIINAWGIVQRESRTRSDHGTYYLGTPIDEISLKSDSSNNCLLSNQILNHQGIEYKIECVSDFNPHFKTCDDNSVEFTSFSQSTTCYYCCYSDTGSQITNCLYSTSSNSCGARSDYYSCDNQIPRWKIFYPFFNSGSKRIDCARLSYIDYNRYKFAKANDVESPQDIWAIDFWFYTATNQAVKEIGEILLNTKEGNNNNFNEFIVEWNYHNRIRVYKEILSEMENFVTYKVECTPLIVIDHPELNSYEKDTITLGDVHYKWTYVSCGVNFLEKNFFLSNNKFSNEKSFNSKLELIPSKNTTLSITENSRSGYGFTFIYQLRLWHCYNCAISFRNIEYIFGNPSFNSVSHDFHGTIDIKKANADSQEFKDRAQKAETTYMYQVANYPGYTLNFDPGKPVICDENLYEYYNEKNQKCERHFNVARMNEDKSRSIPSSRNGRYTMDFWFYVENSAELSPGLSLLWENHLSITLLRDMSNKNTINAICFPQSYKDNVYKKMGQDIIDLFDKATNKDKYAFYKSSSTWNFIRCAVDQTRKRFYINDNIELDLEGEILYGTTKNYRPFRYFNINKNSLFHFLNARFNPTRIFLRQIKCYREYIDFRLMDLKYIACEKTSNSYVGYWIDPCQFYPLAFCFDYGEILGANWPCNDKQSCFSCSSGCGLIFHTFNENKENEITPSRSYWLDLLNKDLNPFYTTFPDIYMPQFCDHGIGGGGEENCSPGTRSDCHLRNSVDFFWPNKDNSYLDLNTLKLVSNCTGSCRPPDSYYKRNFCFMEYNTNNMISCQNKGSDTYSENYKCKPGYTKVYYECIDSNLIPKSALYFSNEYSFPNTVFDSANKSIEYWDYNNNNNEDTRLVSYYIEVYMKFDSLNYRKKITNVEHYLYAHPHQIIKDPSDQNYKYSNRLLSGGYYYYPLTSISNFEWNHLIIENLYDYNTKQFSIKVYVNNEFNSPQLHIPDLDSSIYKLHFRGIGFCNKIDDTYCKINDDIAYIRWGSAWYRNLRVWDADITTLELIQTCDYGFTQTINSQKYYFPLTIDTLDKNTIKDIISPDENRMKLNYWYFYLGEEYLEAFDNDIRINYSTDNFDKIYFNENNYISGIDEDSKDYTISACAIGCKRCYSSSNNDCYECSTGYSIYGKQCRVTTGYFFKTPPKNTKITKIEIKTKDISNYFDIEKVNPITITLYIKYFGIDLSRTIEGKIYYILACFYKDIHNEDNCLTYIGYNYIKKTIVFIVNNEEIYESTAKNYIGIWTHFGISIHRQIENDDCFPNMLNFMIDQKELIQKPGFNPTNEAININTFTIYTESVCLYSSFKVYSTFYFGTYGHINTKISTRNTKLLYFVNLFSSSSFNCITNTNFAHYPSMSLTTLEPNCIEDYHPYEDSNNICSDDDHFMDVIYKVSPPCESCNSYCITNCFNLAINECTCDYYEGLYWIKTDENYTSYECERVDSINFGFFDSVTIYGLDVVKNDEMTMAFWLDIYEYRDNKFDSLEIIWNQHLAVKVKGNGMQGEDKYLDIECHGDYDINNHNFLETIIYYNNSLKFNRWNYITCQADKFHKVIRVNGQPEEIYRPVTYSRKLSASSLTIVDRTKKFNYGFSFVRELKLYSSYNYDFWDDSFYNLKKEHFNYLLHHFRNDFNYEKLSDAKIIDQIQGTVTKLNAKSNRIGYNYVMDYEKLVICEEGYVYNNVTKTCNLFNTKNCIVVRDEDDNCLLCSTIKPYLKENDHCYSDCGVNYYSDDYLKQCRKCDELCYTCSGKYYNNCLSCSGDYYYIETLHICIKDCQEYGLIISTIYENTCEELIVETEISSPVYLNNSYDYNPLNKDYSSKIIDRNNFKEIVGHIIYSSSPVLTEWIYNWEETLEINKPHRFFKLDEIPRDNPIISNSSYLSISVKTDYFKNGYKYIFDLELTSTRANYDIKRFHRYIIMMNDYPEIKEINILPNKGYITNNFLMSINECKDDISKKNYLQYKFTYFTKKENITSGYNESSPEEILIQDWTTNSEVLYQFTELNPLEGNKYYIRGYCMDEFGLYYSSIQEVEVYDIPTISNIDIPLEGSIESFDINEELTSEQVLNRAHVLATSTVDFDKGIEVLNRTNITDFNRKGLWQQNLILNDPTSSQRDIYCNYRGDSYVIYFYLVCDCYGYDGNMCQIDHNSYDYTIDVFNKLFYKIKIMQTTKYNLDLIKSIDLLMKSGAAFMDIDNMDFFLDAIDIINLHTNQFTPEMLKKENYQIYFNIYNSLIEYGLSLVNKLKYRNFISKNLKNQENLYNSEKIRNATLSEKNIGIIKDYFNRVKSGLQSLLEFYALNKKELRFINENINVYVTLVSEYFPFDSYFNIEKKIYEPYIDFKRCLERNIKQDENELSYRIYFTSIIWKASPYMFDKELYWDTVSPVITFKFLDYITGEKVYLSNCGNADNQIKLYFPINNYHLVNKINEKRELLSPENQFDINDDIFSDPVYINKSGAIFNTSPEERREKYFLGLNFSCKYYKSSTEEKGNIILSTDSLDYHEYTKENYAQCLLNKLLQESYGEYVVDFHNISGNFHLNSRLFYLKHYQLLTWKPNYNGNFSFYFHLVLLIIYFVLSIAYYYIEKYNFAKMQSLPLLRKEIAKMNLPYREEYVFDSDLLLEDNIKTKLTGKRKPNMEEMNLDINNLNIDIMADEIIKYNKGFKTKENNIFNFNPNYFGIKEINTKKINLNFFPKNNDIFPKIHDDNEISSQKLAKLKKFYQVGFKGLDKKENIKKDIKLSTDKTRIVINKKQNLDQILELNEEQEENDLDIEFKINQNFFDKKSEIDNQDKKADIKKITHKKKISKNLTKYQDYISSNSDIDSKSKLRNSNRSSFTNKFFNSNPPKKEKNFSINKNIIFNEKEQQKIGKSNSSFFNSGTEGLMLKNKRKEKNLFQKEYETNYKPNFKGPKIIGENLGFYNYETDLFEQDKDSQDKNPPYFGTKKPNIKNKEIKDENKGQGQNAEMKVGFYYKTSQINLDEKEGKLPSLVEDLNFEQKMEEFRGIGISFKGFLLRNIISRYILITTFSKINIAYKRYMRAGNFVAQLSLFSFFLSIFFSLNENMRLYETGEKSQIPKFILYCFLSDVFSCIMVHIPAYCFWINDKKIRKLYNIIRTGTGMNLVKQTENILKKGRLFWNILGTIIQLIYVSIGFYFSFGFCATYYLQKNSFCLAMALTCGIDFFFTEFIWEIFIGFLFYISDLGRIPVFFGTIFNRFRNIKRLV